MQWINRIWYLKDFSLLGHLQTILYFPIIFWILECFCLWILLICLTLYF
jgi:hypothetical protein